MTRVFQQRGHVCDQKPGSLFGTEMMECLAWNNHGAPHSCNVGDGTKRYVEPSLKRYDNLVKRVSVRFLLERVGSDKKCSVASDQIIVQLAAPSTIGALTVPLPDLEARRADRRTTCQRIGTRGLPGKYKRPNMPSYETQ